MPKALKRTRRREPLPLSVLNDPPKRTAARSRHSAVLERLWYQWEEKVNGATELVSWTVSCVQSTDHGEPTWGLSIIAGGEAEPLDHDAYYVIPKSTAGIRALAAVLSEVADRVEARTR